ncbi:MAG TPA: hypothetical protein VFS40_10125 [Gemmatimonadales bacterium]|nr:hypothetical protein [Gemmatimonadales bacterium]
MGCLTLPFRLLGCLGLIVLLALGWLYRDRLVPEGRRLLGLETHAVTVGRPTSKALASARTKLGGLARGTADSVVLSPGEAASLIAAGLDPLLRRQLDSVRVGLERDAIRVDARLHTARLPKELVGPLALGLRQWEPVRAEGPLRAAAAGQGDWEIRRVQVRGVPVPTDLVPRLVQRAFGDSTRRSVPVALPRGVRDLRITPEGVTLYGTTSRTTRGAARP